ncbi:MAG: hypothetical protein JRN68_06600 [Nitrososphaerota archaeon]|nr:hypothetical protein [Nitrososphaerota archaeon]
MTKFIVRVIAANRITIPKHVAQFLSIEKGDFVEVEVISVRKEKLGARTIITEQEVVAK